MKFSITLKISSKNKEKQNKVEVPHKIKVFFIYNLNISNLTLVSSP